MPYRTLIFALTLFAAPTAFAAADLDVTVSAPSSAVVYDVATWDVTVANVGNRSARNVSLTVQLPVTNTSPVVHIMGDLDSFSSKCSLAGTALTCNLGKVRKNKSKSIWFDIALPASAAPITVSAGAATTSNESNLGNNTDSANASLTYYATAISGPRAATNRHCTGQGLTAFFECAQYPSSISTHDIVLEGDYSVSFPNAPASYGGVWSQPTTDTLVFDYTDNGTIVAQFSGVGVGGDCFEGLTTFPNSAWVSPYEVCLQ